MRIIKTNPVRVHRKFDEAFKRETVQNWLHSDKSAEVIAQELGLHSNLLYVWRKRFAPADAGGRAAAGAKPGSLANLQAQLVRASAPNRAGGVLSDFIETIRPRSMPRGRCGVFDKGEIIIR